MSLETFVRCVRGLEWVAAAEARGRVGASVESVRHREVWLRGPDTPALWTSLRVVDDAFLRVTDTRGVGRTRADLRALARAASKADWLDAAARAGRRGTSFEVIGSFLGKRNYTRFDIEDAVGAEITASTGWEHRRRSSTAPTPQPAAVSVRVHVEDDHAGFGIRFSDRPLHRRTWKHSDVPGSLHPPVTAALGLLAGLADGMYVADPFCGAGTIAIEALLEEPGIHAVASDLSPGAVLATSQNAVAAGTQDRLTVLCADAGRLPLRPGALHRVITNLPWDKAVRPAGLLTVGLDPYVEALPEVLAPSGRATMLVGLDEVDGLLAKADAVGCASLGAVRISVAGTWAGLVFVAASPGSVIDPAARFGDLLAAELRQHSVGSEV